MTEEEGRLPVSVELVKGFSLSLRQSGTPAWQRLQAVRAVEDPGECATLATWFGQLWNSRPTSPDAKKSLLDRLRCLTEPSEPAVIYAMILYHLFQELGEEWDEERIVKSATGIRETKVWKKLFTFQRDGVIGAIDKLERLGGGQSGDIDLAHVNWGNYDLVVIDESHHFRNKSTHKDRETRYDRLMRRIIQAGVKTRVLMLSATPVNHRLADLKNQIAFVTEAKDTALEAHGIASITATVRQAQLQFNRPLPTQPSTCIGKWGPGL